MHIRLPLLAAGVLFLPGCIFSSSVGTWLLEISVFMDDMDDYCTEDITSHNFTGATVVPDEEDVAEDYTVSDTHERSGSLAFARIEKSGDGAFLVIEDKVFPGQKSDTEKKTWIFQWVGNDYTAEERNHVEGYDYTSIVDQYSTSTYKLTFDGDSLSGTFVEDDAVYEDYTESDTWPRSLAQGSIDTGGGGDPGVIIGEWGDIPAQWYLERPMEGPQGGMEGVRNGWDTQDCDSEPCNLSIETTCSVSVDVVGTRTNFSNDEAYDAIENAGQNAGL